jgi:putative polyhydroxyalkanoic acid system protein
MNEPITISIPHKLGKDEALSRLKAGMGSVRTKFGALLKVEEETWNGDELTFRVSAVGQTSAGTITAFDNYVLVEVQLPWLLAKIAEKILPVIRKEGQLMLEKK